MLESRPDSPLPPWIGPCKECYCHKNRIAPLLTLNPISCITDVNDPEKRCRIHEDLSTKFIDRDNIYCNHNILQKVKQVDYEPKSDFLKNLQDGVAKSCIVLNDPQPQEPPKLEYTERRSNYETNRPPSCYEKDYYINAYHGLIDDKHSGDSKLFNEENNSDKKTNTFTEKYTSSLKASSDNDYLRNLLEFRDKNFFDCFSTVSTQVPVRPHKCVHQFTINDRLYPLPVNSDPYGVSHCAICSQSMEHNKAVQTIKNKKLQAGKSLQYLNKISKRYEHNLMPRYLNIGTNKETIHIKMPKQRITDELLTFRLPHYECHPLNSYALRFQKGVMK